MILYQSTMKELAPLFAAALMLCVAAVCADRRRQVSVSYTHLAPFGADDKELEAIFTRTYGESKRKLSYDSGPRQVVYDAGTYNRTKKEEPVEEYLLVDGYNILYAWDELRELMKVTLDGARHRLMDMLCNYQGYRRCNLIVRCV